MSLRNHPGPAGVNPSGAWGGWIIVAAAFGAATCPGWVVAEQGVGRAMPRRAESSSGVSAAASRGTPPVGPSSRGPRAAASGPQAPVGRSGPREKPASSARARAQANGVRQTSAIVSADGGVVLAGHAVATADCGQCGQRGCGKCRLAGGRLDLPCNGLCEQGGCPAHCPVRPDQFGYYATRWRSWPGQSVKQAGQFDPATTPVVPPRSEVPGMVDELALPNQEDEAAPDDGEDEDEATGEEMEGGTGNATPAVNGAGAAEGDDSKPVGAPEEVKPQRQDRDEGSPRGATEAESTGKAPATEPSAESGAAAAPPVGGFEGTAWANWARGSVPEATPAPRGDVVPSSDPIDAERSDREAADRDPSKLRSPAQKYVERNDQTVQRWRAKAVAAGATGVDMAGNPLRGVTAQPGNPLR